MGFLVENIIRHIFIIMSAYNKKAREIIHGLELTMSLQELLFDDALFGIRHATNLHIDPI